MSTVARAQPARYGGGLRHGVLAVAAGAGAIAVASGIAPGGFVPASLFVIAVLVGSAQQALP